MNNFYVKGLSDLAEYGSVLEVRGQKTVELTGYNLNIDPYSSLSVRFLENPKLFEYLLAELAWYFSGEDNVEFIETYASLWGRIKDNKNRVVSNYGKHIFYDKFKYYADECLNKHKTQFQFVRDTLRDDIYSRQAVITLRTAYNNTNPKDNMCTQMIQFLYREDKLDMIVYMRSNDIVYGLTYDAPFFSLLQILLAKELGVKVGNYKHIVGSFHIYEKHFKELEKIEHYNKIDVKSMKMLLSDKTFNDKNLLEDMKYLKEIMGHVSFDQMEKDIDFKTTFVKWLWRQYYESIL